MIIGITGLLASGKDTVAEYLVNKGFKHYSLSDEIREELKKRKLDPNNRDNLINVGNELRTTLGRDILAKKAMARMKNDQAENAVFTSIRNPSELDFLRKNKGFKLISVEANAETRFNRLKSRGNRSASDYQTIGEFIQGEEREKTSDPNKQQLQNIIKQADIVIDNNGTLVELHKKIEEILEKIKH